MSAILSITTFAPMPQCVAQAAALAGPGAAWAWVTTRAPAPLIATLAVTADTILVIVFILHSPPAGPGWTVPEPSRPGHPGARPLSLYLRVPDDRKKVMSLFKLSHGM